MQSLNETKPGDGRLGILAGSGLAPIEAAAAALSSGEQIHIVALRDVADGGVAAYPHSWVGLGEVGGLVAALREHDCRRLLIIGGLKRPDLFRLRIDLGFVRHLALIAGILRGGDDAVLRRVIAFFESQGQTVVGVGDVAPGLLASEGRLAGPEVVLTCAEAIATGARALADLSRFDAGQACVARADGVVAFEDGAGTADLLARLAATGGAGPGAVLVKLPKRNQEVRVDLPAIGAETIHQAYAAGLSGVAIAAGRTVVLDRERMAAEAVARDVFVVGIAAPGDDGRALSQSLSPDDDGELATAYVRCAWPHLAPDTEDFGVVVRRGHAYASLRNGFAQGLWPSRLKALARPGPFGMLWTRRGAITAAVATDEISATIAPRVSAELNGLAREKGLRNVDVIALPSHRSGLG